MKAAIGIFVRDTLPTGECGQASQCVLNEGGERADVADEEAWYERGQSRSLHLPLNDSHKE